MTRTNIFHQAEYGHLSRNGQCWLAATRSAWTRWCATRSSWRWWPCCPPCSGPPPIRSAPRGHAQHSPPPALGRPAVGLAAGTPLGHMASVRRGEAESRRTERGLRRRSLSLGRARENSQQSSHEFAPSLPPPPPPPGKNALEILQMSRFCESFVVVKKVKGPMGQNVLLTKLPRGGEGVGVTLPPARPWTHRWEHFPAADVPLHLDDLGRVGPVQELLPEQNRLRFLVQLCEQRPRRSTRSVLRIRRRLAVGVNRVVQTVRLERWFVQLLGKRQNRLTFSRQRLLSVPDVELGAEVENEHLEKRQFGQLVPHSPNLLKRNV